MTFVLGIGTAKKWEGRQTEHSVGNIHNADFLWHMDYKDVKEFIKDWKGSHSNSGLGLATNGAAYTNKDGAQWKRAYIYDTKGNVNILVAKYVNLKAKDYKKWKYELLGKYKLSEPQPHWEKVKALGDLIWDYHKDKLENKAKA
jgi:hypothetical protein